MPPGEGDPPAPQDRGQKPVSAPRPPTESGPRAWPPVDFFSSPRLHRLQRARRFARRESPHDRQIAVAAPPVGLAGDRTVERTRAGCVRMQLAGRAEPISRYRPSFRRSRALRRTSASPRRSRAGGTPRAPGVEERYSRHGPARLAGEDCGASLHGAPHFLRANALEFAARHAPPKRRDARTLQRSVNASDRVLITGLSR